MNILLRKQFTALLAAILVTMIMPWISPVPALSATIEKMPSFALVSVEDGAVIDSKSLSGKVILFNFFATWCPPCRQEIPHLIDLQKKYSHKGFMVIGISTDQGGTKLVNKFRKKMKINYPVLLADPNTPRDFGNIIGIPTNFLVDRDGRVVKRYDGYIDHRVMEKDVSGLLGEKAGH